MTTTKIAVLGMGRMGQAATMALLEAGHEVYVWNRTLGKTWDVVEAGAHAPADLAATIERASIVLTVLSDDDAVREVVLGDSGVAARLEDRLYVDASTVSPAMTDELAERIERYVAMPIAGAPALLQKGEAVCLVGGASDLAKAAAPLIEAFAANAQFYARPRHAVAAKIANNTLLLNGLVAVAECIAVGRAGGLSDGELHQLLSTSSMLAPGVGNRLQAVLDGDGPQWWTIDLGTKDARLALDLARHGGAPVPLTQTAYEQYDAAASRDLGDHDVAVVSRIYSDG